MSFEELLRMIRAEGYDPPYIPSINDEFWFMDRERLFFEV